jgi:hypothetical protein
MEQTQNMTDAEILEIVRRLRTYMSTYDNCFQTLSSVAYIGDAQISANVKILLPKIISTAKEISNTLKQIEGSRGYKDMLRHFNMEEVQ